MNILILAGSARPKGTSILLAEEFKRGAEEAGAAVDVFHAGTAKIHGCLGCGHCEHGKNPVYSTTTWNCYIRSSWLLKSLSWRRRFIIGALPHS
jgi:multimeric flavodoxin WrbA